MANKIKALFFLVLFLFINSLILVLLSPQRSNLLVSPGLLVKRVKPELLDLNHDLDSVDTTDQAEASKLDGRRVEKVNPYPVAVMIDNHVDARPQVGLSRASFIYETLVEGGATRFMAIFDVENNDIKKIGPVRSARPYFVEWAKEYNALYVHAGGSPQALAKIAQDNINDLNEISWYGTRYFYRDKSFSAPHNLFTNSSKLQDALIWRELNNPTYSPWLFATSSSVISNTDKGESADIYIDFSPGDTYDAHFIYDKENNQYVRVVRERKPWFDPDSNEELKAANIIVQLIPAEQLSGGKGRLFLDIYGEGKGFIFQNGEMKNIYWQKEGRDSRTKFYYQDDQKEVILSPGLTWIVVVPGDREIKWGEKIIFP